MIFFDTETCGLTGPIVIIQYAEDDGEVIVHEVFNSPIKETMALLEMFTNNEVCAFNLSFDWFHVNKLYNLLYQIKNKDEPPKPYDLAKISITQPVQWCLKPKSCLDLMLHARKGPWQTLMDRDDIVIKKVPADLAPILTKELTKRIRLPNIYFQRRAGGYEWQEELIEDEPKFCNIKLHFAASSGLKALAAECLKVNTIEFPVPKSFWPEKEPEYNPYNINWLPVIHRHIQFWKENKHARSYAEQDVIFLQRLYHHFGEPSAGDTDSILAGCVGSSRWRGYTLSRSRTINRMEEKRSESACGINPNSHIQVRQWLKEVASEDESALIVDTSKKTLEALSKWETETGQRAKQIIKIRSALKEIELLNKLLEVGRFNPDFKIIGTKSGRMSGGSSEEVKAGRKSGSINPQGIPRIKEIRELFTLADKGYILSGGDFDSFEVTLADAAYKDDNLRSDLRAGKSFHAMLGSALYQLPYQYIIDTKNKETNLYHPSKTAAFALLYGAQPKKLAESTGISEDTAEENYKKFMEKYPGIDSARRSIFDRFCSISQPKGVGTEIIWHEPDDFVESLLGFRRYFTLENNIVRLLFKLAQHPPDSFNVYGKIYRRNREQTIKGATQSALYSTVFQLQARNMRAAANHVIQSTGAEITKEVQRRIWDVQPSGIHKWIVQPFNIHDEIMCVHIPEVTDKIKSIVNQTVDAYKPLVPLIKMEWKTNLEDWSKK